ncbi:MAG: hypothetical protein LBF97_06900 [Elusimicrobiota bacterium]|nr:hypothetical protein [Elusimicrobiota bacterium]
MPSFCLDHFTNFQCKPISIKIFTRTEILLMLKYSPQHWRLAILLGCQCGHRPEEMLHQLRKNIDINTGKGLITENQENKQLGITHWVPKIDFEKENIYKKKAAFELGTQKQDINKDSSDTS